MLKRLALAYLLLLPAGVQAQAPVAPTPVSPGPVQMQDEPPMPHDLFRRLLPAVVNITARSAASKAATPSSAGSGVRGPLHEQVTVGSGFIIDPAGTVVTNWHVIEGAYEIVVVFADGSRAAASVINGTRVADLALLQVHMDHPLEAVRWGDSDKVQIGDAVVAVGNPLGIGQSVTSGIVSALNRDIMESPYDDFIQTDAAINHGNSGGPLFNLAGEVIGVNTAIVSPTSASSGLGFAIPANGVRFLIGRLKTFGWLRPGWMGMKVQQVTPEMASAMGLPAPTGSVIADLTPDAPAMRAGLQIGDVVTRVGKSKLGDERALLRDIAETTPGDTITLAVTRGGHEQELPVTVAEWPRSQWDALDAPVKPVGMRAPVPHDLGMAVTALDAASRAKYGVPPERLGVLVTNVVAGSDAGERGLVPGDVILRVQDKPVTNPAEWRAKLDEARAQKRDYAMVLVWPKVHDRPGARWVALRVGGA